MPDIETSPLEKKPLLYFSLGLFGGLMLLYNQLVFQGKVLFWRDVMHLYTVFQDFIRDSLWAGDFPFWNPYLFTGTPQMAFVEPPLFYPGNWLFLLLDFAYALPWVLISHQLLTGIGCYLLCRSWRISPFSSSFAGYAWSFSGVIIAMNNIYPLLYTVSWFPLLLWSGERVYRRSHIRDWLILVLVYALQVLSGHLEIVYFSSMILVVYLLFDISGTSQHRWQGIGRVFSALVIGTAISALQLLPTIELLWQSTRQAGTSMNESQYWSLHPGSLFMFMIPDIIGNLFSGNNWGILFGEKEFGRSLLILSVYVGVSTCFFAVCGCLLRPHHRHLKLIYFWGGVALVTLLLALGHYLPVYSWFHQWVPGFHFFRYPVKLAIYTSFALIIMAACGLEALLSFEKTPYNIQRWVIGLIVTGVFATGLIWYWQEPMLQFMWPTIEWLYGEPIRSQFTPVLQELLVHIGKQMGVASAWLLASWLSLWLCWNRHQHAQLAQGALLFLICLDLIASGLNTIWATDAEFLEQPSPVVQQFKKLQLDTSPHIRLIKARQNNDIPPAFFQHYILTRPHVGHFMLSALLMKDNLSLQHRFHNAYAHSPARTYRVDKMYSLYEAALESPFPEFRHVIETILGVRYIHAMEHPQSRTSQYYRSHPQHYRLLEQHRHLFSEIWENKTWQPRVHFKNQAFVVPDENAAFQTLLNAKAYHFNPRKHVVLLKDQAYEQAVKQVPPIETTHKQVSQIQIVNASNNAVEVYFSTNHSGYLVLADQYYPGWRAWNNGQEVPILQANYIQRAIRVGSGTHHIHFAYQPTSFYIGLIISGMALLLCLTLGYYGSKSRTYATQSTPLA